MGYDVTNDKAIFGEFSGHKSERKVRFGYSFVFVANERSLSLSTIMKYLLMIWGGKFLLQKPKTSYSLATGVIDVRGHP